MKCLLSNRYMEDDTMTCLCTCLNCGFSFRIIYKGWTSIICICCKTNLVRGQYLNKEKFQEEISSLEKDLERRLEATSKTIIAGFSPAAPFESYRKAQKKLQRISAHPKKPKKS